MAANGCRELEREAKGKAAAQQELAAGAAAIIIGAIIYGYLV
jgi:hypothetical protein